MNNSSLSCPENHRLDNISVKTLIQFLLGDKQAIRQVAHCRAAIWLGCVFVMSAGLAREYDGEDLWHQPWHLLIPLVASVASSLVLFGLLWLVLHRQGDPSTPSYRMFLTCFWMTAPLAWWYALPVERFLSPPAAVGINLSLLGLVALWRVLLITRVVMVLYGVRFLEALPVVILFSDIVVLAVLYWTPLPVFSLMGGIRLTESELIIQGTSLWTGFLGVVSLPVWLCGTLWVAWTRRRRDEAPAGESSLVTDQPISRGLWATGLGTLVLGAAVLPLAQPEQQNRHQVERMIEAGRVGDALDFMSRRTRGQFPPHWDPPPRPGYGQWEPPLWRVVQNAQRAQVAAWVREVFVQKMVDQADGDPYGMRMVRLEGMTDNELSAYVTLIRQLEEGPQLARYHQRDVEGRLEDAELSERRREALLALQQLAAEAP